MKSYLTPEEYLARERVAEQKSEYFAGQIYAMAGASRRHTRIVFNMNGILWIVLKGTACTGNGSDMRVKVSTLGKYTYPDLTIVCGKEQFEDGVQDTLLNPTVIVEVLSDSTEKYDRGKKFEHYRQIESLREYLLISQNEPRVEKYLRKEDGTWIFSEALGPDGVMELASVACELHLADVYAGVEFQA
jgi:Uma2 family endonuclease